MKKFKDIFEQHREKGRFHPVKPHNVASVAAASPRSSSDSANVKLKEDLRKWFSKTDPAGDWKRINSKGEAIGPCAREPGEPKPKCMSKEKRASLSKKERASAVKAKRKHDPNPERKGEPINVSNFGKGKISEDMENLDEKNVPTSPEKWAQAKSQAKAKFDVYPSAYANGWAAKKYKEMGGGWKSVSEENSLLEKWSQKYKGSIDCDNPKGFSQKAHCDGKEKNEEVQQEGAVPSTEKVITVKHKTSGKTLRISANAAQRYRTMGYHYHPTNEEVEQIDELSDELVGNYLKKANTNLIKKVGMKPDLYNHLEPKRQKGATRALNRLMKPVKEATSADSDGGPPTAAAATLTTSGQPVKNKANGQTKMSSYVYEGSYKSMATDKEEDERLAKRKSWKVEGKWKKSVGTVTDKSGAKHTPMSRARDLARQAAHRNMAEQSNVKPNPFTIPSQNPGKSENPESEYVKARSAGSSTKNARARAAGAANPHMFESRQLEIVREARKLALKKKKQVTEPGSDDKYIADPELSSQITKSNP